MASSEPASFQDHFQDLNDPRVERTRKHPQINIVVAGWEGMYHLWITELLRWVKPRLPIGYRTYIGSAPMLAVGAPAGRPDFGVREWPAEMTASDSPASSSPGEVDRSEPDVEVAVASIDPGTALFVES